MNARKRFVSTCRTGLWRMVLWSALVLYVTGCRKALNLATPSSSPQAVFDEVWHVVDERYALFPLKNVDWNQAYAEFSKKLNDTLSDWELFRIVGDMLYTLQDGHVSLITNFSTSTYDNFYKAYPANFNWLNIKTNYLNNQFSTIGPLIFKLSKGIAYTYYGDLRVEFSDDAKTEFLNQLKQARGLILDLRNNQGGNVANSEWIFSHFIQERALVKYEMKKKGKGHSEFANPEAGYVSPQAPFFPIPVVVLVNRSCYSACNDLLLYLSGLSNVTLVGDQSGGGGGIPRQYLLPNGWVLQYTSTQTLSPLKQPVENGISPDYRIDISPIDESQGRDPILEKAIQLLQ